MTARLMTALAILSAPCLAAQLAPARETLGVAESARPELLLGPPKDGDRPVVVKAGFQLQDINGIDDESETFEFTGVLVLRWQDPRQAFDPKQAGIDEKIYQGGFQFDEISLAWYPQVVLSNRSGLYEVSAVLLRVQPDGTSTLLQMVNAVAEADLNMRRYPFDSQRLDASFEVLGFGIGDVVLEAESLAPHGTVHISQWKLTSVESAAREKPALALSSARQGTSSAFVVSMHVTRRSFFMLRLVVLPLTLIVILSWSVFWMDRSSLGDRINLSFVGILTAVAYQIVVGEVLPDVSYITLMHAFLNLCFLVMSATVVINLVVGGYDKAGKTQLGDLLDHRCRYLFPLVFSGLSLLMTGLAFLIF